MPDSYQAQGEPAEQEAAATVAPRPKRPSIFADPVVRWLTIIAFGLVIMYMVTVLSALVMGILNPTEPRTRAERDIQYYELLTAQNPKDSAQWKAYVNALIASKQYLKAQDVIDRAKSGVDQTSTRDLDAAQAALYFEQKKYKEAIKLSDQVRKNLKAYYDKAKKAPGTAEAKGQEINENYWTVLLIKSSSQEALGDAKGAIKTLDVFIKDNPTAADVLVKRGLLKAEAGDKAGAEKDFRAALKYLPNDEAATDALEQIGVKP